VRLIFTFVVCIVLLLNLSVFGQEDCDAFGKNIGSSIQLGSSDLFFEAGFVGMQQWLDPNIDSTLKQQRYGWAITIGKTAKRKFEWGMQLQFYRNSLAVLTQYNSNIEPFTTANHFEVGPWFWYSISESNRLGIVASTGLNMVKIPDDPLAIHISYFAAGTRFYPLYQRKFRLFLEPKFQFNPSYLIGSEVSLITYNYQFSLLFGARYIFR
jgi:hypothetical protein